jgi:hypothetical protein
VERDFHATMMDASAADAFSHLAKDRNRPLYLQQEIRVAVEHHNTCTIVHAII